MLGSNLLLCVCFYRLVSGNYVIEREIQLRLMDVLPESRFSGADHSPCPGDTNENGKELKRTNIKHKF